MKTKSKWILGICFTAIVMAFVAGVFTLWHVAPAILMSPRSYTPPQMWSITHEWTRTAPLSSVVTEVKIESSGSDFTRQFKASARFPDSAALTTWITASPGFSDAEVTIEPDGRRVYLIKPGGGALFAEITVHPDFRVEINTYWS